MLYKLGSQIPDETKDALFNVICNLTETIRQREAMIYEKEAMIYEKEAMIYEKEAIIRKNELEKQIVDLKASDALKALNLEISRAQTELNSLTPRAFIGTHEIFHRCDKVILFHSQCNFFLLFHK